MGASGKVAGKAGRRGDDPLPDLAQTLFGPFGCLSEADIETIHNDVRWYGDCGPIWKNAPTAADANGKALAAIARLEHRNFAGVMGTAALALIIASCSLDSPCGSHACPRCGRAEQHWFAGAFGRLLRKSRPGYEDYSFNFVMPEGQVAIADLSSAPFDMILGKCRIALLECKAVEFAVLGIDTSANDDTAKFKRGRLTFGPRVYWQVHVYGVVRTSNRQAVWDALRHLFGKSANIFCPLHISAEPFDGANKGISYVCKPDGFRHVPYFDEKRGEWNTPRSPLALKAKEHVYYLLAMHDLGFARRIALVGLHPVETKATKYKKRGVSLRRIYRGGHAM